MTRSVRTHGVIIRYFVVRVRPRFAQLIGRQVDLDALPAALQVPTQSVNLIDRGTAAPRGAVIAQAAPAAVAINTLGVGVSVDLGADALAEAPAAGSAAGGLEDSSAALEVIF